MSRGAETLLQLLVIDKLRHYTVRDVSIVSYWPERG
jgi:hypothetical protein